MNIESAHCYILTVKGDVRSEVEGEVLRLCDTLAQTFPDHNVQKLDSLQPVVQVQMEWDGNSWAWPKSIYAGWMEIIIPDPGNIQVDFLHIPTPVEGACIIYGDKAIDDKFIKTPEGLYILNKKSIFDFMNFVPGFYTSPFISQMISVLIEKYKSALETNECLNNEVKSRQIMEKGFSSQIQSFKDKCQNLKKKNEVAYAEIKEKTAVIQNYDARMKQKVEALLQKVDDLGTLKSFYESESEKFQSECEKLRKQVEEQKQNSKKCLDEAMDNLKNEQKRFKKMIHEQMESAYDKKVKSLEEKIKKKDATIRAHEKQIKQDAKWIKKQNKEIVNLTDRIKETEENAVTADEILDYAKLRGLMVDMCEKAGITGCSVYEGSLTDMMLKVIGVLDNVMAKINQYSEGNIDMHSLTIMVQLFKANKKTKYTFKDMHELFAVQHYQFDRKLQQFMKMSDKMREQKIKVERENHNLRSQLMRHILQLHDESGKMPMNSHVLCKDIVVVTNTIMASEVEHGLTFWSLMVGKYSLDTRLHIVAETIAIVATRVISATQIQRQFRRYYYTKVYHQLFNDKTLISMSTAWHGTPDGKPDETPVKKGVEDFNNIFNDGYVHSYNNYEDPKGKYGVKYYCMSKHVWKKKGKIMSTSDKKQLHRYKYQCAFCMVRYFVPRNMDYIVEQIKNLVEVILMKEIPVSGPPVRASTLQKKIRGFYRNKEDMIEFSQSDGLEDTRAQLAMMYQDRLSDVTDEINILIEQYPKTWPSRLVLGVPIPQGDIDKLRNFMFHVFEQQKEKDRYFVNNHIQKVPRDLISIWHLSQHSAIRLSVKWNTLHNCVVSGVQSISVPSWFTVLYGKDYRIDKHRSTSP